MDGEDMKALVDGINAAMAVAISAQMIAREVMVDVARLHPDPDAYLGGLYDRVIAHVDHHQEVSPKQTLGLASEFVGTCFRDARAALAAPPSPGHPPQ